VRGKGGREREVAVPEATEDALDNRGQVRTRSGSTHGDRTSDVRERPLKLDLPARGD
jgi:hypothetical protein